MLLWHAESENMSHAIGRDVGSPAYEEDRGEEMPGSCTKSPTRDFGKGDGVADVVKMVTPPTTHKTMSRGETEDMAFVTPPSQTAKCAAVTTPQTPRSAKRSKAVLHHPSIPAGKF